MIPDLRFSKHMTPAFHGSVSWSPEGPLVVTCMKRQGGGSGTVSGINLLSFAVGSHWGRSLTDGQSTASDQIGESDKTTKSKWKAEYVYEITWLDASLVRERQWLQSDVKEDVVISIADRSTDLIILQMEWSPLRTTAARNSVLALLITPLDVVLMVPPKRGNISSGPYTVGWVLSEIIYSLEGSPTNYANKTLLKMRLHSMDWSASCGPVSPDNSVFSLLATGNENGEIYLWSADGENTPQLLETITVYEHTWITGLKFSPVVRDGDNARVFIAVYTSKRSVHIVTLDISEITTSSPKVMAAVPAECIVTSSRAEFTSLVWIPRAAATFYCIATVPGFATLLTVEGSGAANTMLEFPTGIYAPVSGAIVAYEAEEDAHVVTLISAGGALNSAKIHASDGRVVPFYDAPNMTFAKQLESRKQLYLSTSPATAPVSAVETRVVGFSHDAYGGAAMLYTLTPADRPRYPIVSQQTSRLMFIPNTAAGAQDAFWDAVLRKYAKGDGQMSPRAMLWCAQMQAAAAGGVSAVVWVLQALDTVHARLQTVSGNVVATWVEDMRTRMWFSESALWERVLASLYDWALSLLENKDDKEDAAAAVTASSNMMHSHESNSTMDPAIAAVTAATANRGDELDRICGLRVTNQLYTRVGLATAIVNAGISDTDPPILDMPSCQVLYQHAQYLVHVAPRVGEVEGQRLKELAQSALDRIRSHGVVHGGEEEAEVKCVACGGFVEVIFDQESPGGCIGMCRDTGHKWEVCALTLLPLMAMNQRHCSLCTVTAIAVGKDGVATVEGSLLERILRTVTICPFCGDLFYIM
ncbi:uncharacterized protein V1518DRAFT_418476 [Limtongia smithiae]|uniref:uncharacterized protein n=1 Tax=Limtongia smithiae TaxID=1125753 RepID=UPI0034CF3673